MGWVWLDGKLVEENKAGMALSKAVFSGYAAVENLPVRHGKIENLDRHAARFEATLRALSVRKRRWAFGQACRLSMQKNKMKHGNLSVRSWLDEKSGNEVSMMVRALVRDEAAKAPDSIRLITVPTRHYGPGSLQGRIKAGAMLPNLMASFESLAWADDGLRLTPKGLVAEGVWTNVVIEKNGELQTPPLSDGILAGVTRERMLEAARKKRQKVREIPLTRYDLYVADKVWVCSSMHGPVRVSEVDGRELP